MSEEPMTTETGAATSEPTLYAGKFKTVEDLEKGYKEGYGVHLKNKELEGKLGALTTVPDQYAMPDGVVLDDKQLQEFQSIAREAKMNQGQFDNAIQKFGSNVNEQKSQWEERQKTVGEENINVLKKYVDTKFASFDEPFRKTMLNTIVGDDNAMSNAMKDREASLNSNVPGVNQTGGVPSDIASGRAERDDLARKAMSRPNDKDSRKRLLNICRDLGHAESENR